MITGLKLKRDKLNNNSNYSYVLGWTEPNTLHQSYIQKN